METTHNILNIPFPSLLVTHDTPTSPPVLLKPTTLCTQHFPLSPDHTSLHFITSAHAQQIAPYQPPIPIQLPPCEVQLASFLWTKTRQFFTKFKLPVC